jgi:hypothetical protein
MALEGFKFEAWGRHIVFPTLLNQAQEPVGREG